MRIKTRHLFGRLPLAVDTRQGVASFFLANNALTMHSQFIHLITSLHFFFFILFFGYFWLGLNFEL